LALASALAATGAETKGYVGSDKCKTCHADVAFNFYKNPHSRIRSTAKDPQEAVACESCHGPGEAHVAAGGGKATIVAFSQLPQEQVLKACLKCHAQSVSRANIQRSSHTLNGVVCTNCHSVLKARSAKSLLAQNIVPLCYTCHADVRAEFSMPFKHRVNEGVIVCTDCHNPHGTAAPTWNMVVRPRLVDQAMGNEEACLKCHSEKRGPFVFEHPVVRINGCEQCHYPHGSTNSRLLRRPVVFTLCLECHNNGVPQSSRASNKLSPPMAPHSMTDPRFQNCTNCHTHIHGSNSDATILR
jgi:DmsE family decaheme c-type cytochrome